MARSEGPVLRQVTPRDRLWFRLPSGRKSPGARGRERGCRIPFRQSMAGILMALRQSGIYRALRRRQTDVICCRMKPASPLQMPVDGRQSEAALAIARGTSRLLLSLGFSCVAELPLASGRRADLVGLDASGEIWIVEIKSSVADFRADQKWQDYRLHCDRLFFATAMEVPAEIFPPDTGLDHGGCLRRANDVRGARAPPGSSNAQIDDAGLRPRSSPAPAGARRPRTGLTATWCDLGRHRTAGGRRRKPRQALQDHPRGRRHFLRDSPAAAITGLLGGNGAGKTTTIAMIMGLVTADLGTRRRCSAPTCRASATGCSAG